MLRSQHRDYAEREDFRDVWTCTIDPRDAKDFDDALFYPKVREWTVGSGRTYR